MTSATDTSVASFPERPTPAEFDLFIPWACRQSQVEVIVVVIRNDLGSYTKPSSTDKTLRKSGKTKDDTKESESEAEKEAKSSLPLLDKESKVITIHTFYDSHGHLVQLKFLKNGIIPPVLLKIIALVLPFHPHLSAITINKGLKCNVLYELSRIVALSKITEIILDDVFVPEANYHILLNVDCSLKYLSLARCKLTDEVIESLASRILSSPLSILNLSSNRITDIGATYLGTILRSNRNLSYLNLSGNMITDIGAESILDSLKEFPLTRDEVTEKKCRYMDYLRRKADFIKRNIDEIRAAEFEKKVIKRKSIKPNSASPAAKKNKGVGREASAKSIAHSTPDLDATLLEKAEFMAQTTLGPFQNPFSAENTVSKDGVMHCLGNNYLCYLNLAYNNLTYFSIKKLYEVLIEQESSHRAPKGLVNVCIEGNNLPKCCIELTEIDYMLESGLATTRKVSTMIKKRAVTKH